MSQFIISSVFMVLVGAGALATCVYVHAHQEWVPWTSRWAFWAQAFTLVLGIAGVALASWKRRWRAGVVVSVASSYGLLLCCLIYLFFAWAVLTHEL